MTLLLYVLQMIDNFYPENGTTWLRRWVFSFIKSSISSKSLISSFRWRIVANEYPKMKVPAMMKIKTTAPIIFQFWLDEKNLISLVISKLVYRFDVFTNFFKSLEKKTKDFISRKKSILFKIKSSRDFIISQIG